MKVGDVFHTQNFIAVIEEIDDAGMCGVIFYTKDGREVNFNYISLSVIKGMIEQNEWIINKPYDE